MQVYKENLFKQGYKMNSNNNKKFELFSEEKKAEIIRQLSKMHIRQEDLLIWRQVGDKQHFAENWGSNNELAHILP